MTALCPTPEKAAHVNKKSALRELGRKRGRVIRPYKCGCGAWHVGHGR